MGILIKSIAHVFRGAARSFRAYPAAMVSALAFAVVAMVRIQLDWQEQEAYHFLLSCLHLALALGAVFGLTAVVAVRRKRAGAPSFWIANLIGGAAVLITFLLLYFLGGADASAHAAGGVSLTGIAQARAAVAMLVSLFAFMVLAGRPEDGSDFARSFFMTHKAFFIALLYWGVMFAGGAGVAGAVQALLYKGMSEKVYMYIGAIAGFIAYAIFVGYFPDFSRGAADPRRDAAQRQPRFIEILLEFILSPLALALTAVLLIWSAKTALTGEPIPFMRLFSIAAGFAAVGLWLHIMVTHGESGLARVYRRVFPLAAVIILIFEARELLIQVGKWGMKTPEYYFILIWIVTLAAAVLLIARRGRAHVVIAALICGAAVFSVLPVLGYSALPVTIQTGRLEKILAAEGMLEGGVLVPAAAEPEDSVKEAITDAVDYLARAEGGRLPPWFDSRLNESAVFEREFGFEQAWPDAGAGPGDYIGTYLSLPEGAMDIRGYQWAVNIQDGRGTTPAAVTGAQGAYAIYWSEQSEGEIPAIRIELDGRTIYEGDMGAYLHRIRAKYPPGEKGGSQASLEDMRYAIEGPEADFLLVFNSVSIQVNTETGHTDYWLGLQTLYIKE